MILRRVRRGWLSRVASLLRWSRFAAYVCIAAAGASSLAWPPRSIREATGSGHTVQVTWAVLMAIAALYCAYGAATDRWSGEYIGLMPLAAVALAFGVAALSRGTVSWAAGLFLFGFFWLLVARWQEVALLRVEADRSGRERNGGTT